MIKKQRIDKTVLVIEDNELNREILKSILETRYKVLEASNGKEGLDVLKNNFNVIQLIFLDIQMPIMNGYEFLEEIKKDENYKQIPIIVTTSEKREEEKALEEGASDFVSKPYSPSILLKRTQALIRLSDSIKAIKSTRLDNESALYNRNYFDFYCQELVNNKLDKKFTFVLFKITNFNYLAAAYGYPEILNFIKFLSSKLMEFPRSIVLGKYRRDCFSVFFDESVTNYDETVSVIKKYLKDSPINNVQTKFGIYEHISSEDDITTIGSKLFTVVDEISQNYTENVVVFDNKMIESEIRKQMIVEDMEKSLENHDFEVYFQPKHGGVNKKIEGAEALIRWNHPKFGFISPDDFIPLFEENGFITKVDFFVLEETCKMLKEMKEMGLPIIPISVNASRRDLASVNSIKKVDDILTKYKVSKDLIHFEITESMFVDGNVVVDKTKTIKNAGYKIEIDDFGSGYSSLGMINEIPFDYLKIDMSFVRKIEKTKDIVKTIVSLANALGVSTIAEGVETNKQLETLNQIGVNIIQGYCFSKPLPKDKFFEYLRNYK